MHIYVYVHKLDRNVSQIFQTLHFCKNRNRINQYETHWHRCSLHKDALPTSNITILQILKHLGHILQNLIPNSQNAKRKLKLCIPFEILTVPGLVVPATDNQ